MITQRKQKPENGAKNSKKGQCLLIVGWKFNDHMKSSLVVDALQQTYTLHQPRYGCIFHSDQGSQYTRVEQLNMHSSMSGVGYDNTVVDLF